MIPLRIPLASLALSSAPARAETVEVLPFDAVWAWLMVLNGPTQVDPATVDPDFQTTWNTPAYNGPAFQSGPAPLSYGGLTLLLSGGGPPGTLMETPAAGTRGTVYFRTTFYLAGDLTNPQLEFLADDGFILYVDGVRWCSKNMAPAATSRFLDLALVTGDESNLLSLSTADDGTTPLPSLAPGLHTLHLSLHNNNLLSSDLGFMLRIFGELKIPPKPSLTAALTVPSTDGSPRILLAAKGLDPTTGYLIQTSSDLTHWFPVGTFPSAEGRTEFSLNAPAIAGHKYFRLAK